MYNPVSTYRIQFNKDFTFRQFPEHIEYFSMLGTGTIYASPVFEATPGSTHGYDITDPHRFNPEIGNESEFGEIIDRLKRIKIGWLQDIVPNHMAFHYRNNWLMDVLEHGKQSEYSLYFDIDFNHPDFNGKVVLPFLAKTQEEALENEEIKLTYKNGKFLFDYFDNFFPVNAQSLISLLETEMNPELQESAKAIKRNEMVAGESVSLIKIINSNRDLLKKLLLEQHYTLAHWEDADVHLNYRRFFTISSLICLQMDNEKVFEDYHSFIATLLKSNKIQGLRIDHIDGLRDPSAYIEKLRYLAGDEAYIIAEKILEKNEELPEAWPLQGSTGYDFLATVNNLFTNRNNYPELLTYYQKLTGLSEDPEEIVYKKKKLILSQSMQADLENLYRMFMSSRFVKQGDDPDITDQMIKDSLGEFLLACPRYKLYSDFFPLSDEDVTIINSVIKKAEERSPSLFKPLEIIRNIFLNQASFSQEKKDLALNFFLRCMQFTGPLMAKGQEDTAMYDYNCLIAHNEVGDSIGAGGITLNNFHEIMIRRQRRSPLSLNATSTHDTKRGEDLRARLAVISDIPAQWIRVVNQWFIVNSQLKVKINGKDVPDMNEEYFIYQTLTGILPFDGFTNTQLQTRLSEYLIKALREAKIHSNWNYPDENYENAVLGFVSGLLVPTSLFHNTFLPFQRKIAQFGILNSLSQLILKSTCPGVPDFYQGTELWDLSLVDPDNRRPVDYGHLEKTLRQLIEKEHDNPDDFFMNLFLNRENGEIKMWMSYLLLRERRLNSSLFAHGEYIPLTVSGRYSENILAFARSYLNNWYVVIIPLYIASMCESESDMNINWKDTLVILPELAPDEWISIFTNDIILTEGFVEVSEVMKITIPCILKGATPDNKRKAGVLLHVTSLPGSFGTGDAGPEAFRFIDLLNRAGQTYWQILPVNPVTKESSYSPYSTYSAFAGNLLLIDPVWLLNQRLIFGEDLLSFQPGSDDQSDFEGAELFRMELLGKAFSNFKIHSHPWLRSKYISFCETEGYWLEDYVLFLLLKDEFKGSPWHAWPRKIRDREEGELARYRKKYAEESEQLKFCQFIFFTQWEALKNYANSKEIRIIGDMSFYVSYDSVDVWQHPDVFRLDKNKKVLAVGGAPPDYFSATGQLWNMPVYDWKNLKENGYSWWLNRISRNLEWFDLVRFDHFRGFSAFWEVPAGAENAVNGRWTDAPGDDFFKYVRQHFPEMPFIAEDLGDIDDKVYKLRDSLGLPGMRVLQFAFNSSEERSIHLPHNYGINSIVYTGTHDNNTTRGWYEHELPTRYKLWIDEYLNKKMNVTIISEEFIRMAYSSVSLIAIVPIQDILGLGQSDRINNPSGSRDNWKWKLKSLDRFHEKTRSLRKLVKLYWRS